MVPAGNSSTVIFKGAIGDHFSFKKTTQTLNRPRERERPLSPPKAPTGATQDLTLASLSTEV